MKRALAALVLVLVLAADARAGAGAGADVGVRVRVDPVVTVVGGASVGFDVVPRDWNSRLSVAAFVVDVPRLLVGFVVPTAEHPQQLKITETCVQLGLFTSFDEAKKNRGFFAGPELYAYQLRYVDETAPARISSTHELYVHATGGYVWFPFDGAGVLDEFFVMPWATLGLPVWKTGGAAFADGTVIADRVANWHATVSVGLQLF